jgi:1-acyl-sn-glycerol-3-phosphate acyltransferase
VFLDDAADRKRVLRYTADLLSSPGRLVWIFPQGAERPRAAPLDDFKPGAAILARSVQALRVVPVGIRYEFRGEPNPEAFLSIGEPLSPSATAREGVLAQQAAVAAELGRIDAYLRRPDETAGFGPLYRRPSQSKAAALAERLLALFTRYKTKDT